MQNIIPTRVHLKASLSIYLSIYDMMCACWPEHLALRYLLLHDMTYYNAMLFIVLPSDPRLKVTVDQQLCISHAINLISAVPVHAQ